MTPAEFIERARREAAVSGHLFPDYAASEAALESGWGESKLAREANNLFGMKCPQSYKGEFVEMPTREYLRGAWAVVTARWVKYPDWASAFDDRMETLRRLAPKFPHYAAALAANDGETFVREVSQTWSTDPNRAAKVLKIFQTFCASPRVA